MFLGQHAKPVQCSVQFKPSHPLLQLLFHVYLSTWLPRVLVVAHEIFTDYVDLLLWWFLDSRVVAHSFQRVDSTGLAALWHMGS